METLILLLILAILGYIIYDNYYRDKRRVRFESEVETLEYDPEEPIEEPFAGESDEENVNTIDAVFMDIEKGSRSRRNDKYYIQVKHGGDAYTFYIELTENEAFAEMFKRMVEEVTFKDAHVVEMKEGRWLRFGRKYAEKALFGNSRKRDMVQTHRGAISIVPNSDEFILHLQPNADLDRNSVVIGHVTKGIEFLDHIAAGQSRNGSPLVVTLIHAIGKIK